METVSAGGAISPEISGVIISLTIADIAISVEVSGIPVPVADAYIAIAISISAADRLCDRGIGTKSEKADDDEKGLFAEHGRCAPDAVPQR